MLALVYSDLEIFPSPLISVAVKPLLTLIRASVNGNTSIIVASFVGATALHAKPVAS
jgi:hypothetical protein